MDKATEKQIQKLTAEIITLRSRGKDAAEKAAALAEARVAKRFAEQIAVKQRMLDALKAGG